MFERSTGVAMVIIQTIALTDFHRTAIIHPGAATAALPAGSARIPCIRTNRQATVGIGCPMDLLTCITANRCPSIGMTLTILQTGVTHMQM